MNDETTQAEVTSAPEQSAPAPKAKAKAKPAKAKKAAPKAKAKPSAKAVKGLKGPAILRVYAPGYNKDTERKTAGGHTSVDNNDKLAQKLRGKDLDSVYAEAAKVLTDDDGNKLSVQALKKQYGKLNVGMQRMNLGNRMRAVLNAK